MKVYFVRHGESVFNAQGIHQHGEVPLSEAGKNQAQLVAKRFKSIKIDAVISSDHTRAKETAETIARTVNREIVFSVLARERRTPSECHGKQHTDPALQEVNALIEKNIRDPKFHFSDEENFYDVKNRAQKLLTFIQNRPEESLLVVLHGNILRYLIATMMYGTDYDWDVFCGFFKFWHENTGITVCEFVNDKWKLITWNDSLHLGEI